MGSNKKRLAGWMYVWLWGFPKPFFFLPPVFFRKTKWRKLILNMKLFSHLYHFFVWWISTVCIMIWECLYAINGPYTLRHSTSSQQKHLGFMVLGSHLQMLKKSSSSLFSDQINVFWKKKTLKYIAFFPTFSTEKFTVKHFYPPSPLSAIMKRKKR